MPNKNLTAFASALCLLLVFSFSNVSAQTSSRKAISSKIEMKKAVAKSVARQTSCGQKAAIQTLFQDDGVNACLSGAPGDPYVFGYRVRPVGICGPGQEPGKEITVFSYVPNSGGPEIPVARVYLNCQCEVVALQCSI